MRQEEKDFTEMLSALPAGMGIGLLRNKDRKAEREAFRRFLEYCVDEGVIDIFDSRVLAQDL